MLYEMVTGRPPFLGDDAVAVISQHINTPPVAPSWHNADVPRALEALILRLLAKVPEDRPDERRRGPRRRSRRSTRRRRRVAERRRQHEANPLDRLAAASSSAASARWTSCARRSRSALGTRAPGPAGRRAGHRQDADRRGARDLRAPARGAGPLGPLLRGRGGAGLLAVGAGRSAPTSTSASRQAAARGAGLRGPRDRPGGLRGARAPPGPARAPAARRRAGAVPALRRRDDLPAERCRASQPLVLVLDDLHWADKPSLLLLQFLARELRGARLLVVGTYRDVELRAAAPARPDARRADPRAAALGASSCAGSTAHDVARFIEITAGLEPPAPARRGRLPGDRGQPLLRERGGAASGDRRAARAGRPGQRRGA